MDRANENTDRLLELSEVIQDYALGLFDTEVKITAKKDELDGIAQGINILGSHLKNKVTSLNTLKGILDSSPLLTITTDLASNITRINKRGLEILNINEYDLLGKHLFDTITTDGEGFQEVYEKVFNEDNLYNFKVLVKTGQNTFVPCYCSAGVLRNAKNQIEGLIFQCQDISELLDVQEQLENTNKDLEAFSYKVAHDIKAPLCSIEGLLHLIKAEDDSKAIKKYTSLFFDSLEFLQNTVNSLLEEAKFTSLKKEKLCHVNFDKLIDLNRKSVNVSLEQNEDDFEIQLLNESKHPLFTDEHAISSILRNLIQNAYKYRRLDIKSYVKVKVSDFKLSDAVTIEVKDNGIGIHESHHKSIFEFGTKVDQSHSTAGFGLYFVAQAIRRLGGSYTLDSVPGEGTTFKIYIASLEHSNVLK